MDILPDLIKVLSEIGFLTEHLALPHEINPEEQMRIKKVEKKENEKFLKIEKKLKKDGLRKGGFEDVIVSPESYNNNTESIEEEDTGECGRFGTFYPLIFMSACVFH